jgi:hypothetical protein
MGDSIRDPGIPIPSLCTSLLGGTEQAGKPQAVGLIQYLVNSAVSLAGGLRTCGFAGVAGFLCGSQGRQDDPVRAIPTDESCDLVSGQRTGAQVAFQIIQPKYALLGCRSLRKSTWQRLTIMWRDQGVLCQCSCHGLVARSALTRSRIPDQQDETPLS